MTRGSQSLGASWIFPVEGIPVRDGLLRIDDGRITSIHEGARASAKIDLGNSAILPGFVNAHTHLELGPVESSTTESFGSENEIEWLKRVIAQRVEGSVELMRDRVAANLSSSIAAGTTLVADTTTAGLSWPLISGAPIRGVVYSEVIGLKRPRGLETINGAFHWLASITPEAQVVGCARPGLSPHAPYSTASWLYERAASARVPLSTHLAEMPEELELLQHRSGPLRTFLQELGAWDEQWQPLSDRPSDYLRKGDLRKADWIAAHGTYLAPDCFWQFRPESAPGGQRVAVAFCPRTHARFGHAPHPYRQILEIGGIVCLGTDSLASASTLSILDEIRFLHRADPSLSGDLLLAMGTLFGAWALRAESVIGSLKPGKSADLAIVALPYREESDPHALILDSHRPVIATMFEGRFISGRIPEPS